MSGDPTTDLSPAPRPVPLALAIRVVLGGVVSQIGWFVAAFGLIFVWAFDPGSAVVSAVKFRGDLGTAEGVSTAWRKTSLSINEVRVYATEYAFDAEGRRLTGVSYQTGDYIPEGERVAIEYLLSDPTVSRIAGMRASQAGLAISFVVIFPLVGLVLAFFGAQRGLKARRLMTEGELALATLRSKEPTNTRINNRTVYRLTFEFEADRGGTYEVVGKTHRPEALEDEDRERVVYDPRNPADAALLDELPCRPAIDRRGNFEAQDARAPLRALLNLIGPALTLLGGGGYLLLR